MKDIIVAFNKEFPDRKVKLIADLNKNEYVVCAPRSEEDYENPYYTYNKTTNKIKGFSVSANFDEFWDAVDNRTVYDVHKR